MMLLFCILLFNLFWKFAFKDLINLHFFLEVEVISSSYGLFLTQQKYIFDLLARIYMFGAKEVFTPISSSSFIQLHDGQALSTAIEYWQTLGSL